MAPPTGAGQPVPGPTTPYIAVPTTAGTGSESTSVAVVSLPERKLKVGVSEAELPRFAEDTMDLQRLLVGNPRRMDADDVEAIFRQSM